MRKQKFVAMAVLSLALAGVAFAVHDQGLFEHEVVHEVGAIVAEAALLGGAQTAFADTVDDGCMQELAGFNLGCTANDVQIATAEVLEITDPCRFPGDSVTFTAQFDVVVTAKERFDIGLYFATDGDDNGDGAISGTCSVSNIDPTSVNQFGESQFVDLDDFPNTGDSCGDITKKSNPLQPVITITTECIDTDGDGFLNLPNCTSWRQSGANELCMSPLAAFPGSPSKCRCDLGFQLPIPVPPAELMVTKTANPTSVDEPGDSVTFMVAVTNTGIDPDNDVTLNSLGDDIYGDITQVQGDILSTTCSVQPPPTITPGGTYTCSFTATVSGNGGDSETDTVTASGVDDNGNSLSGTDDATVTIVDVLPAISVVKDALPTTVLEGSMTEVTFTVMVNNDSVADPLTITSLTDDLHGDLNGQGNCATGGTIAVGGSYTCSFTAIVDGQAFTSETDTVTAVGVDDEFVDDATTPTNKVSASDSATVTILDDEAMIELIKTADPTSVNEEGDDVTYTFTVNNLSNVDTVTINTLDDTIHGDLNGQGNCTVPQVLVPTTGTYTCSITVFVAGDAGDVVTNVATAEGVDDDGLPVMASDDATVNILDVPPAASLTKTATMVVVTYDVVVTNDSTAEDLFLNALSDDQFGDITQVQGDVLSTTCGVPQTIAVGGSYPCSFEGKVSTSPHTDIVTGTVSDNEGGSVTPSDSATVTFE